MHVYFRETQLALKMYDTCSTLETIHSNYGLLYCLDCYPHIFHVKEVVYPRMTILSLFTQYYFQIRILVFVLRKYKKENILTIFYTVAINGKQNSHKCTILKSPSDSCTIFQVFQSHTKKFK